MIERVDVVVIGAGVVGLAAARAFARAGREVLVLECNSSVGAETSSRNSGVIHAGIYYPADSLKAKLCVRGKQLLYNFCQEYGVPYKQCGKLLVATADHELATLTNFHNRANANGVYDLHWLKPETVQYLEPEIECVGALLSPSTGIVDAPIFLDRLQADVVLHGGSVVLNTKVSRLTHKAELCVQTHDISLKPKLVVNCAGLNATALAAALGIKHDQYFAKGQYFEYQKYGDNGPLFQHLIYPVPTDESIGIHITLDLHGGVKFGPDVQWLDQIDYDFNHERKQTFVAAIQRFYPNLDIDALKPGYTGIRSKLVPQGAGFVDFRVQCLQTSKHSRYLEAVGIDSPGLTASLALGEYLVALDARV